MLQKVLGILKEGSCVEARTLLFVTIGVPLLCYALAACVYFFGLGRYGMALAFFSYSLGNVGFLLDAHGK